MRFAVALVAFAALVGSAQAFTYDSHSYTNADGTSRFTDPDNKLTDDGSGTSGANSSKSGWHFQFSGGSSLGNSSGVDSRFAPTSNPAFNSPFQQPNNFDLALSPRH